MSGPSFESLVIGERIPSLTKGPISPAHIMRWSAAIENWHRIHYDWRYATEHDKLPDVLINGSWKQHVLIQLLVDWLGETGWLWKVSFQFRAMNVPGETLTAWGVITGKEIRGRFGVAMLEIGLKNKDGVESTPGKASVVLPLRDGPALPYPFTPEILALS